MKSIYYQKSRWKLLLLILAALIGGLSLFYTNRLVKNIETQERKKMELWAKAQKTLASSDNLESEVNVLFDIIGSNDNIPVILTDANMNIESSINFKEGKENDLIYLQRQLRIMRAQHDPIINRYESEQGSYVKYVFYKDSALLYQLKYYPLYQLAMISLFILVAYVIFSLSRRYEQDYVWVGMAKETAHQLGTPISSLVAWHQLLSAEPDANEEILEELKLDVNRLELITERFSKIGSVPDLERCNIHDTLKTALDYIKTRSSDKVSFEVLQTDESIEAKINTSLFNWVVENLAKNSIDAMAGAGQISVDVQKKGNKVIIDFSDTGKGISGGQKGNVFKPGYSTKKRGWGLGLTLVKRIVENYHHGKIFVRQSSPGKGTTFRIILPEAD